MADRAEDVETGNDPNEDSQKESSNRGKLVVCVALLAFLVGGGIVAGVWWFLEGKNDDSPSPANTAQDSTPSPMTSAPVSNPTLPPNPPTPTTPPPTSPPTTEEEGLLQNLFDDHAPLWDDAADWLLNSDMYEPEDYSEMVERYALAVLFYRTRGENLWNFKQGWLSANSVCNGWRGINCNAAGKVTGIELVDNSLVGPMPSEIGILTALTSVTILNSFEFTGSLPKEIASLTALRSLVLRSNYLGGAIPSEIAMLTSLTTLDLENNIMTGTLPGGISRLTNLRQLSAGGNELDGAIPDISTLSNLRLLELDRNQLTNSIPELITMEFLEKLDLKTNKLGGAIPVLPLSLQDCDLEWNRFTDTANGVARGCVL